MRHHQQGEVQPAEQRCREALALDPDNAEALHLLGILAYQAGNYQAAAAFVGKAIARNPHVPDFHSNLGLVRRWLGDLDGAILAFREALRLQPSASVAHNNLGNALRDKGELPEAAERYREALRLAPDYAEAQLNLMQVFQQLCDWSNLDRLCERIREIIRHPGGTQRVPGPQGTGRPAAIRPAAAMTISSSAEEQLLCARSWVEHRLAPIERMRDTLLNGSFANDPYDPVPKTRLRIGYLSTDFRPHPVAYLVAELFELHDRDRFEVIAYSIGPDDESDIRHRIIQGVDRFTDLKDLSFADAARRISQDGVDIVIDLNGYTKGCRTEILALRPAPIQVNYLGYPGTMGASFIDYILTDPFLTPPDQQPFFVEKFAYLPDCHQVNPRQRSVAAATSMPVTPIRPECNLPEDAFVFCCFNSPYKFTPAMFDVWMRLLKEIPESVLWLSEANRWMGANLRREAAAREVDADRLVFAPKLPSLADHLARQRLADLFLDTLPYNAHSTAGDALWAGLPVLTCAGQTYASRVAGSLLTAIGLPELITFSLEEYEYRALHLARHPEELASLREKLRINRNTFPLFDTPRFTRHLEAAYFQMWEALVSSRQLFAPYTQGNKPDTGSPALTTG
jgi:predicted O-linked N-acetylglucosamine transferase (SPINDLY family)